MRLTPGQLRRIIKEEIVGYLQEDDASSKSKKISYTAIVLDKASHEALLGLVPEGWDSSKTCHHCTLTMGSWKGDPDLLGKSYELLVRGFAKDDKVAAVSVDLPNGLTSKGTPHVTVAVTGGGKPFLAGKLDFSKSESPAGMPGTLRGVLKEVEEGDYSLAESVSTKQSNLIFERWVELAGIVIT